MSEKVTVLGACGLKLEGKLWKQGGSVKCPKRDLGLTRYPRPIYGVLGIVRDLCPGCEFMPSAYKVPNSSETQKEVK